MHGLHTSNVDLGDCILLVRVVHLNLHTRLEVVKLLLGGVCFRCWLYWVTILINFRLWQWLHGCWGVLLVIFLAFASLLLSRRLGGWRGGAFGTQDNLGDDHHTVAATQLCEVCGKVASADVWL